MSIPTRYLVLRECADTLSIGIIARIGCAMTEAAPQKFQLTYMTFTDKDKQLGHACIGVSQIMPDGTRELVFRVGLFPSNQVELEDFIKPKPGRVFREKSFDITAEQLLRVLHAINSDRMLEETDGSKEKTAENRSKHDEQESIPSGPGYDKLNYNCKDYALSVMRRAGIRQHGLENIGISLPILSGNLKKVIITPKVDADGNKSDVLLIEREEQRDFIEDLIKFIKRLVPKVSTQIHKDLFKNNAEASQATAENSKQADNKNKLH